jgi:hypothetical protein
VAVTLTDEVYRRAERLAQLTSRDLPEVLADALALSLPPLDVGIPAEPPPADLSDEEVLALAESSMPPAQDRRLSRLLRKQAAGGLTRAEHAELLALMEIYQAGLLRKGQALGEAVRRGLRDPLKP